MSKCRIESRHGEHLRTEAFASTLSFTVIPPLNNLSKKRSKEPKMNSDLSGGIHRQEFDYDVCIVGTGRVGLPLALSFIEQGLSVVGLDKDPQLRAAVNSGSMPFKEPGYDDLVSSGKLRVVDSPEVISQAANVIVTVGTPLHNHIETDLSQIQNVLKELHEYLRQNQLICLRSTVAPGTTTYVKKWLERSTDFVIGENLFLAFCPERIAEEKPTKNCILLRKS